ncbi:class I SAM-dependent methyltransferase [Variovorax sp. LARHSF232]
MEAPSARWVRKGIPDNLIRIRVNKSFDLILKSWRRRAGRHSARCILAVVNNNHDAMHQLSEITSHLLQRTQIARGMRVLDIGCGNGELSRAISDLVGLQGSVVGLDGSPSAIEAARSATQQTGLQNIEYVVGDLSTLNFEANSFDCIVGRRVLMYVPSAQDVLASLAAILRPGGRMGLQEHDATMTPGRTGSWPLHDQVHRWIWEAVRREGANPNLGLALAPMLQKAGMAVQALWAQAIFAGYEMGVHYPLHEIVGFMQSRIVALGVATAEEIDVPTLGNRLEAERQSHTSTYVADMAVCVVATRSEAS